MARTVAVYGREGVVGYALVDEEDYERVSALRWNLSTGYARATVGSRTTGDRRGVLMHRFILGLDDPKEQVDHRDRNRLNNQRTNLRTGTDADNRQNLSPIGRGVSRHRGVTWCPRNRKWRVRHRLNGKWVHLGLFSDEEEAGLVAANWRAENLPWSEEAAHAQNA